MRKIRRIFSFAFLFCGMLGLNRADAIPSKTEEINFGMVVQFRTEMVVFGDNGRTGDIGGLDFEDETIEQIFARNQVVYVRSVFDRHSSRRIRTGRFRKSPDFSHTYLATCANEESAKACIEELRSSPNVIYAESNRVKFVTNACSNPQDPYFAVNYSPSSHYQWWFTGARAHTDADINIFPAWNLTCGSAGTLIGYIDTGFRLDHEDFGGRISGVGAADFHGTRTAGVMMANANAVGVIGVVQNALVRSWTFGANESAVEYSDSLMSAVDYWGCDVIGTSHTVADAFTNEVSVTIKKASDYVFDHGVPFIAASGNFHDGQMPGPAAMQEVIAVGASDTTGSFRDANNDGVPDYNHGHNLDLIAPGEDIISTDDASSSAYAATSWGTSFAQPLVTGVCALMHTVDSTLVAEDYMGVLAASARDLNSAGFDTLTGWGLLDAGRSVVNLVGRYHVLHGVANGGALADSVYFKTKVFGFSGDGFTEGQIIFARRYTIETDVTWPAGASFVDGDSVFCWGMADESTGLRHNVVKGSIKIPTTDDPIALLYNRNISYPDYSTITSTGATFHSYYYRLYNGGGSFVTAGQSNPDSTVVSYGVIGPYIPSFSGHVVSDSTISGTAWVAGDILVESDVELTIASGTTLLIAGVDSHNLGSDTGKIEIIVDGTLSVEGTSGAPVTMRSGGHDLGDDAWVGIVAANADAVVEVDFLELKHAEVGLYLGVDSFDVRNSAIDSCGIGLYANGATGEVFNVNASNCADKGFYSVGSSGQFSYARFDSCRSWDNTYGFVFGAYSDSSRILNRCIASDNTIDGVLCQSGMKIGPRVEVSNNGQIGLHLKSAGSATLVDRVWAMDQASGIGCYSSQGSSPEVRNSYFADNYDNVACKYSSYPKFGQDGTSIGQNNTIDNATRYDFGNFTTTTVYAENCYWGPEIGGGSPAISLSGSVDIMPYLTSAPAFSWRMVESPHGRGLEFVTANYPNPFNPITRVDYAVGSAGGRVDIAVYDLAGRLVRRLDEGFKNAGRHTAVWNGLDASGKAAAAGVYFVRVDVGGRFSRVNKVSLIK